MVCAAVSKYIDRVPGPVDINFSVHKQGVHRPEKDHTTVIHGCTKIEEELKTNEELQSKIDAIIKKINPN